MCRLLVVIIPVPEKKTTFCGVWFQRFTNRVTYEQGGPETVLFCLNINIISVEICNFLSQKIYIFFSVTCSKHECTMFIYLFISPQLSFYIP